MVRRNPVAFVSELRCTHLVRLACFCVSQHVRASATPARQSSRTPQIASATFLGVSWIRPVTPGLRDVQQLKQSQATVSFISLAALRL